VEQFSSDVTVADFVRDGFQSEEIEFVAIQAQVGFLINDYPPHQIQLCKTKKKETTIRYTRGVHYFSLRFMKSTSNARFTLIFRDRVVDRSACICLVVKSKSEEKSKKRARSPNGSPVDSLKESETTRSNPSNVQHLVYNSSYQNGVYIVKSAFSTNLQNFDDIPTDKPVIKPGLQYHHKLRLYLDSNESFEVTIRGLTKERGEPIRSGDPISIIVYGVDSKKSHLSLVNGKSSLTDGKSQTIVIIAPNSFGYPLFCGYQVALCAPDWDSSPNVYVTFESMESSLCA